MPLNKLSFFDKVANRNSLHVDVTWQVWKTKDELQIIIDSCIWVLDDDSSVKYYDTDNQVDTAIYRYLVNTDLINKCTTKKFDTFFHQLTEVFSQLDARTYFEVDFETFQVTIHKLEENDIYSPSNNNKVFKFIRLNDKNSYLRDSKNPDFIPNFQPSYN